MALKRCSIAASSWRATWSWSRSPFPRDLIPQPGAGDNATVWYSASQTADDITAEIRDGRVGGYLELRDTRLTAAGNVELPVAWTIAHVAQETPAVATPAIEISASDIRARVLAGRSIRYLVPEAVAAYVARNHLYE